VNEGDLQYVAIKTDMLQLAKTSVWKCKKKAYKAKESQSCTEGSQQLQYVALPISRVALTTVPVRTRSEGCILIKEVNPL
jgi:hypothetical protein